MQRQNVRKKADIKAIDVTEQETEQLFEDSSINIIEESEKTEEAEESEGLLQESRLLSTPLFASDYQYEEGWPKPENTLNSILNTIYQDGYALDNAVFCGDYTNLEKLYNYETSPDETIKEIQGLFYANDTSWDSDNMIFVQGNHDAFTEKLNITGLYGYKDYLVYVMGTQFDFPWKQGALGLSDTVWNSAEKLKECLTTLSEKGENVQSLLQDTSYRSREFLQPLY